jgi:transposase-like protein
MAQTDPTRLAAVKQAALLDEPDFLRDLVQQALQTLLEAEMEVHLGAGHYERTDARRGYRNGYKPRTLQTRVGTLDLLVPQDRDGSFSTELFGRYQRSEQALVLTLMEMYLQGVSTRKVTTITEQLCGTRFSKSQVSKLTVQLDARLQAWRERPLTADAYPYLTVDARYEKVRQGGQIVSQGVLLVSAVRADGFRELVAVDVAETESEATYQELFRSLKARGLSGVQLVTSDDHQGLRRAIERHFQGAGWQRCQVWAPSGHSRNLQGLVSRRQRADVAEDLRTIFACATSALAWEAVRTVVDRWQPTHSQLAERLEEDIEDCFACLAFPVSHQRRIRTTNGLERVSQELKRRTRVVRIFPNRAACLRLVTALAAEISEDWESGRRYLNMEEVSQEQPIAAEPERPAAD